MIARLNVPKGNGEHGSTPPTFLCIKKEIPISYHYGFSKRTILYLYKDINGSVFLRIKIDLCDLDLNVIPEGWSSSPLSL